MTTPTSPASSSLHSTISQTGPSRLLQLATCSISPLLVVYNRTPTIRSPVVRCFAGRIPVSALANSCFLCASASKHTAKSAACSAPQTVSRPIRSCALVCPLEQGLRRGMIQRRNPIPHFSWRPRNLAAPNRRQYAQSDPYRSRFGLACRHACAFHSSATRSLTGSAAARPPCSVLRLFAPVRADSRRPRPTSQHLASKSGHANEATWSGGRH